MKGLICAAVLLLAAGPAWAASVYLKEGGRLEGVIVVANDSEVVLDTAQGRVRVERSRVQSIADASPPAAAPAPMVVPAQTERRGWRRSSEPAFDSSGQTLSLDFGVAAPLSDIQFSGTSGGGSSSNGNAGPAFGLQYLYGLTPRFAWGVDFHYYGRAASYSPILLPSSDSHVFGDTVLLLGLMKYSLVDRGTVRPYAAVGAGAYRNSLVVNSRPQQGFVWSDTLTDERRTLIDDSAAGFAGTVRLGLDFGFYDPSVFSLEAAWTGLTSATYHPTADGRALGITGVSAPLNYFTFVARWGFNF